MTLQVIGILIYSLRGYSGLTNQYYWYEKGFNVTRAITLSMVLFWELFPEKEMIEPMHAWDRYADL